MSFSRLLGFVSLAAAVTLPLSKVDLAPLIRDSKRSAAEAGASDDLVYDANLVAGVATFYFEVEVGTPAQPFRLIADTGSSYMAITGQGCESYSKEECSIWNDPQNTCPSYDPPYNYHSSSSSQLVVCGQQPAGYNCSGCVDNTCAMSLFYGDGSCAYGSTVSDIVSVEGDSSLTAHTYFGNLFQEAGDFANNQTDGIIGLAYSSLSQGFPTFIDQLVSSTGMTDMFAMCLGGPNPTITLGGLNKTQYEGQFQYTPIIDKSYYVVQMSSISFGKGDSHPSSVPSIVDSGTTGLILAAEVFKPILEDMQSECAGSTSIFCDILSTESGLCWNSQLSLTHLSGFPKFKMSFPDAEGKDFTVTVPGEAFTLEYQQDGMWCYTFIIACSNCGTDSSSTTAAPALNILGDAFMKAFYVSFDRANSQMGFAESACLKSTHGYFYYYLFGGIAGFLLLLIVGAIVMFCCNRKKKTEASYSRING